MKPFIYEDLDAKDRILCRDVYAKEQGGNCCHCNYPLDGKPPVEILDLDIDEKRFPANFFQSPVHLHHDHETGLTVGTVHSWCNAVLWQHHGE